MVVDKMSGRGKERAKLQEERLRAIELENAQLRQQLEWHSRLLAAHSDSTKTSSSASLFPPSQ